jgi:peptide/nickel transport system permease protein
MKQSKTNWAVWVLSFWLFVAVFKDIITNECPLYCNISGQTYFPAFQTLLCPSDKVNWPSPLDSIYRESAWLFYAYDYVLFAPIPFSAGKFNKNSLEKAPFYKEIIQNRTFTHYLGTDTGGRDVAAAIVAGARVSLLTGLIAITISGFIGLFLGGIAGFFRDNTLLVSRGRSILTVLGFPIACFFAFVPNQFYLEFVGGWRYWGQAFGIFVGTLLFFNLMAFFLNKIPFFAKKIFIPIDFWVLRLIEIFNCIPRLLLIICLIAMASAAKPSLYTIIAIIGAFSWTGIARLIRGELLRIRELPYIQAAQAAGFSNWHILVHHALPNAFRPIGIALAVGCSSAIMLEASLGFLGFSSVETGASWGSLLNLSRGHFSLWWLAIFPGLAIFSVVLALNRRVG